MNETQIATEAGTAIAQILAYYAGLPLGVVASFIGLGGAIGGLFGIRVERKRARKARTVFDDLSSKGVEGEKPNNDVGGNSDV